MRNATIGAVIAFVGTLAMNGALASEQVCKAQQAAAGDLVEARDGKVPKEEVVAKVRELASSQASADVLAGSVDALYADSSIDVSAAGSLIFDRCISALGR